MAEGRQGCEPTPAAVKPVAGAILGGVYGAAGLAFYVYSGQAEGLISPRLGFLLVVLSSVPLGLYMLMALMLRWRWPRAWRSPTASWR